MKNAYEKPEVELISFVAGSPIADNEGEAEDVSGTGGVEIWP